MKKKMFFCLLVTLCMAATFADREIGRNARTSTYADSVEGAVSYADAVQFAMELA